LTFQQLIYFVTSAEHGSFNAAARVLHCSQPAVSDQVRRLESELGVPLFTREGRGLTLTPAGRTFREHAERVMSTVDEAASSVGRGSFRREQLVTMGIFRNAPYYLVADLAARFHAANPDIRLHLPGQNSAEVAAAVQSGEFEAGLVVLPVEDRGLDVRPLFRDEVLYVSTDASRAREPMTFQRLAQAPLVLYDARSGFDDPTRRQLATRAQQAGLALTPRFDVEHVETALQLAALGVADTVAARALTLVDGFPKGLRAVGFAEPLYDTFTLITRRGAVLSSGTRRLIDAVGAWADDMSRRLTASS
jgi:DNA-binding transcriptional LysR family regulator